MIVGVGRGVLLRNPLSRAFMTHRQRVGPNAPHIDRAAAFKSTVKHVAGRGVLGSPRRVVNQSMLLIEVLLLPFSLFVLLNLLLEALEHVHFVHGTNLN